MAPARRTDARRPARIEAWFAEHRPALAGAAAALTGRVAEILTRAGLAPTVVHRVKATESYLGKLERLAGRADGQRAGGVADWIGVRVVCPFLSETERAEELVRGAFAVTEVERKGTERGLEQFGYDSIHLLVRLPEDLRVPVPPGGRRVFEVQIRTILQDAWAQIEHRLVYKSRSRLPRLAMRRKLAALAGTLTLADVTFQDIRDQDEDVAEQDARRRQVVAPAGGALRPAPLRAPRRDVSRLARPDPALRDPRQRRIESLILEALSAHGRGDLEDAIELYGRSLRHRGLDPRIRSILYNHRGIAHLTRASWRLALADFGAAIRCDPSNHRAFHNVGLVHRAQGRRHLAIRAFRRALEGIDARASAAAELAAMGVDLGPADESR